MFELERLPLLAASSGGLWRSAMGDCGPALRPATGFVALGGLIFGCGLPGWPIVCWVFNFIEKNRDAGIDEVAKEVQEVL